VVKLLSSLSSPAPKIQPVLAEREKVIA